MTPVPYHVTARREETADTVTLDLAADDASLTEPLPGQFMMMYAFGVGEVPISVSGCPSDDGVLSHTIRAVGPVSHALCGLVPGRPVGLRGPFGTDWPLAAAEGRDLVVVGGGIGLAPLRPVVRRVLADRGRFGRVTLLVGARRPDSLLFASQLADWRGHFDLDVSITVDAASGDWRGDVGVVTKLLPRVPLEPARTVAVVCGPEVMIRAVARELIGLGVESERLFVSLERNMRCGLGHCGHCQLGPLFVCTAGPVVAWSTAVPLLGVRGW
jgi:NAD(P)H-flavin reductase